MTNEKYMNMIRNNPYVIDRIENPSEEMQLLAVQMNGLALQYIKHPSEAVQKAAVANTARAIQFIDHPSEDMLLQAVQSGWNNLSYIKIRHRNSSTPPWNSPAGPSNTSKPRTKTCSCGP